MQRAIARRTHERPTAPYCQLCQLSRQRLSLADTAAGCCRLCADRAARQRTQFAYRHLPAPVAARSCARAADHRAAQAKIMTSTVPDVRLVQSFRPPYYEVTIDWQLLDD